MKFRKITAVLSALTVSAGMLSTVPVANAADFEVNYAEALQKSMFFYQVQQAGELPEWNAISATVVTHVISSYGLSSVPFMRLNFLI